MTLNQALNNKNFENEFEVIVINNDKPISFTDEDYKVVEGSPYYTDAKKYGKSGYATAIISENTLAIYTSENIEYPKPINWTRTIKEMKIYNKSHIIGYSLSAKKANSNNIFIGTEYLNKITMKSVENEVYKHIKNDKRVFLYKVTPKYKFKNDIVPIGVLIEAKTIDDKEKIQICRFCYNIQAGIKINYFDGSNIRFEYIDKSNVVKNVERKAKKRDNSNNKYQEYLINVKTKTFHLREDCSSIRNTESKYIQETKAYEKDIIKKEFNLCKKCCNRKH